MKINKAIRAPKVRLINEKGEQVGIVSFIEALRQAEEVELDLVEMDPNSTPPVCKIMNFDKFRYDQTKKEKENKKAQHQIRIKEIKLKPNIDEHDFQTKLRHAKEFLEKGDKVKVTCVFRGREVAHQKNGHRLFEEAAEFLKEVGAMEAPQKFMGKMLFTVFAPLKKKK